MWQERLLYFIFGGLFYMHVLDTYKMIRYNEVEIQPLNLMNMLNIGSFMGIVISILK